MELSVQDVRATILAVFCLCCITGTMGQSTFTKISEDEQELVFECVTFGPGTTRYEVTGCGIEQLQLLHTDFRTGTSGDCYNSAIGVNATARSIITDDTSYRSNLTIHVTASNATIVVKCFHELGNDRTPVGVPFIIEPKELTSAATSATPPGVSTTSDLTPGSMTTAASTGLPGVVTAAIVISVFVVIIIVTTVILIIVGVIICKGRSSKVEKKLNKSGRNTLLGLHGIDSGIEQPKKDGDFSAEQPTVESVTSSKEPEAKIKTNESQDERDQLREENRQLRSELKQLRSELQRKDCELQDKKEKEKMFKDEIEYLRSENSSLREEIAELKKAIEDEKRERKEDVNKLQQQREEDIDKLQRQHDEDDIKFTVLVNKVNDLIIAKEHGSTSRSTIETDRREQEELRLIVENNAETDNATATSPERGQSSTADVDSQPSGGQSLASTYDSDVPSASVSKEHNVNSNSAQRDPMSKTFAKTEYSTKRLKYEASVVEGLGPFSSTVSSSKDLKKNGDGSSDSPSKSDVLRPDVVM